MGLNDGRRRMLPWLLLGLAVIVTAAVYWPGLTGGWVFDDFPNIVDNNAIHITPGHATLAAWVNAALSSPASFLHRPLASITFALNWYFGGGDPWPFKLTNVVIHLLNGVLVFCMLRALLRLLALRRPDLRIEPAAAARLAVLVAAGWMLLPINLMAVLYVVQRMESLCQVLILAGLWAYLHGRWMMLTATDAGRDRRGLTLAAGGIVIGTLLGLTSKETAVLLPVFCFLAEAVVVRFRTRVGSAAAAVAVAGLNAPSSSSFRTPRSGDPESVSGLAGRLSTHARLTTPGKTEPSPAPAGHPLPKGEGNIAEAEPSPAPAGHPLPKGEGNNLGAEPPSDAAMPPSGWSSAQAPTASPDADPLSRRERRGGEGTDAHLTTPSKTEPSPAPAGHPLPKGEGNNLEAEPPSDAAVPPSDWSSAKAPTALPDADPLSRRERRGGEGADTRAATLRGTEPSPAAAGHSLPEGDGNARQDKRIWTLFTVTLFVPAALGFAWLLRGALRASAWTGRDFTLAQRLLTEPRVLVDYLHWTLLPNPEVLSLYHDEIAISTGLLTPWTTLGAMLLLAALVVAAVLLRNRRPLVALGIAWFFASQLLTATIVPLELVYEQRMYFGSIGVLLAAGALLMGLRWNIKMPLLRGFIVAVALLWFGVATNLRAQEWSNPLRQAVIEAHRHPTSGRAVYEAGRLLLIASNYQPGKARDEAWKYLREASAIPGSSALPDQAMIMLADHDQHGDDAALWESMTHKLATQPTRQEDISALVSLTNCYNAGICKFDTARLNDAYLAALSRPHPIARLDGAYAAFQRDTLHDGARATKYLALAVQGDPTEPAYRIDLAALYAGQGETEKALEQIDALRRMNLAGRLDPQIALLERLAEQGKPAGREAPSPHP